MFNEKKEITNCERRKVVKDFCFPDGIEISLIKEKGEAMSELEFEPTIQNLLYN